MDLKALLRLSRSNFARAGLPNPAGAFLDIVRLGTLLTVLACTACGTLPSMSAPPTLVPTLSGAATSVPDASTSIPPGTDTPLAALVNGQPIYLADYERELSLYEADLPAQGIDPASPEGQAEIARAGAWILEWMITEVLSEQAAMAAGITVSDAEVDATMQQIVAENGGEESFQAKLAARNETYEDAWRKQRREMIVAAMQQRVSDAVPEVGEQVHARHILVNTQEEAERLLAQLQAGADFATLASTYSQDPNTRDSGGDLGFFPRGLLTAPEVEEAAFSLQPGQFSGVVPSLLGYHIVQVVERDPARPINPDDRRLLQDQALQEWVESLWAQAVIQIFVEMAP
jgi:parvulin-like peptidyl-prolyl isomerase